MSTYQSLASALNFQGKTVLVTGGSDGIGLGIAKSFLAAGASVSVTGTKQKESYTDSFDGLDFYTLDVTKHESIAALTEQFSTLDVLVNCVGTVLYKKQEFDREGFEWVLNVNLTGVMDVCQSFSELLIASKGNIVNLDSVVSIRPAINNPAYSASKAGLVQLTKSLAMKWGRKQLRVNTIAPGMVPTKLTANQQDEKTLAAFLQQTPLNRVGTPEDIAGAALFFASPLAAYVTGQHIAVDGGMTL